MESILTLIDDIVDSKPLTPSLNNTTITTTIATTTINNNNQQQTQLTQPRRPSSNNLSFEILKDGYEPDEAANPSIKRNRDNSNTKKTKLQDNINSGNLIDESSSEEPNLENQSPQPQNPPPSFFTTTDHLSTIPEQTEIPTTIASELDSRLFAPTTTRSSSSDGSVSPNTNDLDFRDLPVNEPEKKSDQEEVEDIFVPKSRRVNSNSNNRDAPFRLFDQETDNQLLTEEEEEGKDYYSSPFKTNPTAVTLSSLTSEEPEPSTFTNLPNILTPTPSSPETFYPRHSEKEILGDWYSTIKEASSAVSISPPPLMAGDRYPTPLRNMKDIARRETRYPSPGTYFAMKSGPLGDLSGQLSPSKRPRFVSPNISEGWPTPTIDTSRPERSGRKTMEGWPTSPRRMQLASPRFKALNDLVEESTESNEQAETALDSINETSETDEENKEHGVAIYSDKEKQKKNTQMKPFRSIILKDTSQREGNSPPPPSPSPFITTNVKNSFVTNAQRHPYVPSGGSNSDNSGDDNCPRGMETISEEKEEEEDDNENTEGSEDKNENTKDQRENQMVGGALVMPSPLDEISELEEEEDEVETTPTPPQPEQPTELSRNKPRTFNKILSLNNSNRDYDSKPDHAKKLLGSSLSRFFSPSIQSRRPISNTLTVKTSEQMRAISETEDEEEDEIVSSDNASVQPMSETSYQDRSDAASTPVTPGSPAHLSSSSGSTIPTTPMPLSAASWRWPKRSFSPKFKEQPINSDDDPADHIVKAGNNIWAKKTLGQLRKYHQRQTPSIWGKGFGSISSPINASLPSPVSDLEARRFSVTPPIPAEQLETITEEEEEEDIGVWSSEEVDLTDSGKEDRKSTPPSPSVPRSPSQIIEEMDEPQGMRVSPESLTIVGGTAVNRDTSSPSSSIAPSQLRNNPHSSSLAKHNAKPLFESTFTISNMTNDPLRYEILWPAFRFDVSPAYGIVKAKGVTVVKISVMMKHLDVGAKRDKKLLGSMLKGSEKSDDDEKPLMGMTRILVLCENGERREVAVNIVQMPKKGKDDLESIKSSKGKEGQSGSFLSRRVDDLFKFAKARRKIKSDEKASDKKGKGKAPVSSNVPNSSRSTAPRKNVSTSRGSSPDSNKPHTIRKASSSPSIRNSRSSTPDKLSADRRSTTSPQPTRSRTPDESRQQQIRQLPQRKNYLYIGVPGHISCPDTNIRETSHSVFQIQNPTNKPVTWHLTTANNPFLKRTESSTQQKITDEVFSIMKTSGFLRPGQSERVDISFRPLFVGTYIQTFMLEDKMSPESAGGLGGVVLRVQGDGKQDNLMMATSSARRGPRGVEFEVSEREVRIPATRVGRRRLGRIKIGNPSNQLIRIKCKCENVAGAVGTSALSISLSSVQIKPHAFVFLPVRFQPREAGETRGVVKLQAVGKIEVKVDIIAEGVVSS